MEKNPDFQSSYAIFPNFTWKEMVNEWQSKQSSPDEWKKYKMLNYVKTLPYKSNSFYTVELQAGHSPWSTQAREKRPFFLQLSSSSDLLGRAECKQKFALPPVSNCIIFHKFTCITAENHESHLFFSSIKYYLLLTLG